MATIVLLAALIATAVARPQAVQFVQAPAGLANQQFLSLLPFSGVNNLPVQNQLGQVVYLQPSAGVSPFGSGSTVVLQVPSNPAPSLGGSVFAVPMAVAPNPAPVIVKQEPVTAAPVTLPPPPPPTTTTTPAPLPVVVAAVKPQVAVVQNVGPAKYSYSYEVNDPSTGDSKSAAESRDGNKVTGFYTVVDPDGVNRKVQYTADENGFVAQVQTQSGGASALKVGRPVAVPQPQVAPVLLVPAINPTQVSAASGAKSSAQFTSPSFSYKWGTN